MIKSTKALFSRILLLLMCFALCCFMPACGGSGGGGGEGETVTYTLTITTNPEVTTLRAGEVVTITATVTGSDGLAASGQAVTFTIYRNLSGGTIAIEGTGTTDANGRAEANYTLGANDPDAQVEDIITVSIPDSTQTITITRQAGAPSQQTVSAIDLSASPTSITTSGSTTSTITVNALSASNVVLTGATITLSADTGILSAATVTTPGTVTFSSGSNKNNRTATITATSGDITAQIPINIDGSTVSIATGASSISTTGSTTVTITVKDAGSNAISGAAVSLTQSGTGSVAFGAASGTTNAGGVFSTTVSGQSNGTVTIKATALGATATAALTITDASTVFYIDQQRLCTGAYPGTCPATTTYNPNPSPMYLNQALEIRVNAPSPIANVNFATTLGTFHNTANTVTGSVITVPVVAGKATAYLTTTSAGIATVSVYNAANISTNDNLMVTMTSSTATNITLQATPTVVSKSVGTTTGTSTLIAMVRGAGNAPVGNAPVLFTIVNPTGGGETVSPVVVMTAATTSGGLNLGEARATFTSGSLPSGATGVQVRASVVGTTVATGTAPSGNDASIVIGGVAGSITFGQATTLGVDGSNANYTLDMSVMVADANGNPVSGAVVNLSLWPIGWSTGSGCSYDADGFSYNPVTLAYDIVCPECGTFWNEDADENLILGSSEDGTRCYYADQTRATCVAGGTTDNFITAVNSAAGTVPSSVTTDENGVAAFTLTYPKTSSIWTIARIRASTIVQGTETVGQVIFRLAPLATDVTPTCKITGSPYDF